jgi:hypothetical protein
MIAQELISFLVERVLGVLVIGAILYLALVHTSAGAHMLAHMGMVLGHAQAWVAGQHQQLHVDGAGSSLRSGIDGISQHVRGAMAGGISTFINASH